MGITLNLPDITIWRVLIKISFRFILTPNVITSNDGFLMAMYVDDSTTFPANPLLDPYGEQYLMWDQRMLGSVFSQGEVVVNTTNNWMLYKEWDIRSHRKFKFLQDTLLMQLVSTGNAVPAEIAVQSAILLRLPR
jgi:hypothetical protein